MLTTKNHQLTEAKELFGAWTPAQRAFMLRLARAMLSETEGTTTPEQAHLLARVRTYLSARKLGLSREEAGP